MITNCTRRSSCKSSEYKEFISFLILFVNIIDLNKRFAFLWFKTLRKNLKFQIFIIALVCFDNIFDKHTTTTIKKLKS